MKTLSPVLIVLGVVLCFVALLQVFPALLAWYTDSGNLHAYTLSALLGGGSGLVCIAVGHAHRSAHLQPRQMFLITATAWLVVPLFGALPLLLTLDGLSLADAVFESVSGMTTTGSTVLVGLDAMADDVLLWRSLLQWFGGMGIIGMAIAVLPFLSVGGMKLFRTESSDWSDKSMPRTQQLLKHMVLVYVVLTLLCTLLYRVFGMDTFNAVNHALSTISTGGYSTSDSSFAQFASPALHWIGIVFMILGASPFVLYLRVLKHRSLAPLADRQLRGMLLMMAGMSASLALVLWQAGDSSFGQALTLATFNLVSVVTTTGFASADFSLWGNFAIVVFFFATFLGGCSGSTSGGIKTFRIQLCLTLIREQVARAIHPRAALPRAYNGVTVSDEILTSLVAFLFVMVLCLTAMTLLLALTGLDLVTSLTGSATALANVGPGLGPIIGPAGNFSSLSDMAKWVLCGGMIMGRLEFLTIIVLLSPAFWRR
jgi:trk system potassium uptake protein TrkH